MYNNHKGMKKTGKLKEKAMGKEEYKKKMRGGKAHGEFMKAVDKYSKRRKSKKNNPHNKDY